MIESPFAPSENPFRISRLNDSRDFYPEWDVEALHAEYSDLLIEEMHAVTGRKTADPAQMIPILLSQPGYGKTHILGRIASKLGDSAFFVFIGSIPDPKRVLDHVRWTVVENLFERKGESASLVEDMLADLLRPSLQEYVDRCVADPAAKARLLAKLETREGVMEIVTNRKAASYHKLAASLAARMPHVRGSVIRAMTMSLSPDKHLARQWLRGEELSQDDNEKVGIHDDSANALDVLNAVAALLEYKKPVVLCFDQIESILKDLDGSKIFGTNLMELLAGVPNQYLIVSSLSQAWFKDLKPYVPPALTRRVKELELNFPAPELTLTLVKKRLQTWPRYNAQRREFWPFDRAKLEQFVRQETPMPAALIRLCESAIDGYLSGKLKEPLVLNEGSQPTESVAQLFQKRWLEEFSTTTKNLRQPIEEESDATIFAAAMKMVEMLQLVGEQAPLRINLIKPDVLAPAGATKRYGMRVEILEGIAKYSVIVGVTTITRGNGLFNYVREFSRAVKTSRGGILLHPRPEYRLGEVGNELVAKMKDQGKLEIFTLAKNREMFIAMQCASGLLEQANGGNLSLGENSIDYKQCQNLIWETGVLRDLAFLQALAKWKTPDRESTSLSAKRGRASTVADAPIAVSQPAVAR